MKVDTSQSVYREDPEARDKENFSKVEMRRLRLLLRRLQFLEEQVRKNGGLRGADQSGGAAFAEWEVEALSWILDEVNFLLPREDDDE